MYFDHPSIELQALFKEKPYQGTPPETARFIFVGLDANFSPEIASAKIFPKVRAYLKDGVNFWREHNVHHPFLLPGYRGDGARYHQQFSKIGFTAQHASEVSFVELVDVPTYGISNLNKEDMLKHHRHLLRLESWFKSGSSKYVFMFPSVIRLLASSSAFAWLSPEPISHQGAIPVYYQSNELTVFSPFHFSCYGRYCPAKIKAEQLLEIKSLTT